MIESLIQAFRSVPVRGKGRLFDRFVPREGTRTVRICGDRSMTLDLGNAIQRMIYLGAFSPHIAQVVRSLLAPGGTFLDIGANVGYFSVIASDRVGPKGRVIAVEPFPPVCASLRRHLAGVAFAEVHQIGLGDVDGNLAFHVPPGGQRDYNVTLTPSPDWPTIELPVRKMDDCLKEWKVGRVDLMKMDVEGAEPRVLRGGAEALRGGAVRHMIVEVNGHRLTEGGGSPAALVEQLGGLGFVPARLAGKTATPVEAATWDLSPESEYDRLFVHRSALT